MTFAQRSAHTSTSIACKGTTDGIGATLGHLMEVCEEVLADVRVDARGWLAQRWEKDSSIISRELVEWFELDRTDREARWTPLHVARSFGVERDVEVLNVVSEKKRSRARLTGLIGIPTDDMPQDYEFGQAM